MKFLYNYRDGFLRLAGLLDWAPGIGGYRAAALGYSDTRLGLATTQLLKYAGIL